MNLLFNKLIKYIAIFTKIKINNLKSTFINVLILKVSNPTLRVGRSLTFDLHMNSKIITNSNQIYNDVNIEIQQGGILHLKEKSWIGSNVTVCANNITLGRYSAIHAFGTVIGNVKIGDYVMIAKNVFISSGKHHYDTNFSYLPIKMQDYIYSQNSGEFSTPVIIEDDVWIGVNCVVMSGVKISKGAVIGSNSVVTKNIEPYSVYAGNPAKFIKKRYDFIPPKSISAMNKQDYPYFYSGFNIEEKPFVVKENTAFLETNSIFSLCLNIEDEKYISLEIQSINQDQELYYNNTSKTITQDFQTITYKIEQHTSDIFTFKINTINKYSEDFVFNVKKVFLSNDLFFDVP